MTLMEIINSIPKEIIWIMGIILVGYIFMRITKKIRNKDDVYEDFNDTDLKDEILKEIIPFDTIEKELNK